MNRHAQIRALAKVNLALDILRKDLASGYHEIRTVLTEYSALADEITIEEGANYGGFDVEFPNAPELEANNTVKTALTLLKRDFPDTPSIYISVQKNIPILSGLGGGSSDAAAVLKQLGIWWKIPHEELLKIAERVGMDCPFFLYGGTALGEHFGEKITPLPSLPSSITIEVITTNVAVSTKDAYAHVDLSHCGKNRAKTDALIAALHEGDANAIIKNIHNDFGEMLCGSGGAQLRVHQR